MRLFSLLLLLVFTVIAGLAFYNWPIFITPNELSLGFTTTKIPLGLFMLGILIFVTVLFSINFVYLQSSAIFEMRRHARELEASRELANKAEASRLTEIKKYFDVQLAEQNSVNAALTAEMAEKADQVETNFRIIIEQLENTLDAYIGEMEDRFERSQKVNVGEKFVDHQ